MMQVIFFFISYVSAAENIDKENTDSKLDNISIEDAINFILVNQNVDGIWEKCDESNLWNCSITLDYEQYELGNNCIKIKGWNSQGTLYTRKSK